MKIALVHDWLESYAGAERVFEQLLKLYPHADVYALVDFVPEGKRGFLQGRKIRTSFIQYLPFARKHFRIYLPLFPLAVWLLRLGRYDLIISDSHCMAKNVRVKKGQRHVCYCHSPIRYAWDMQEEYLAQTGMGGGIKGKLIRLVMSYLRWFDVKGSNGVSEFYGNSRFIAQRIVRCYGREAGVLHPPVAVQDFPLAEKKNDFYLTASRLVPYKKMDLIVKAFAKMPDKQLVVIGDGSEMPKLQAAAAGMKNIRIMGYQPFDVLKDHMQRAKAFVFAAKEDFGITPVEAMSCGTPVIAFGEGGVLDTVMDGKTGILFGEQTGESIISAVEKFEKSAKITAKACRAQAEKFSEEVFRKNILTVVG